ncbi:MAG TPA: osmotically inducible protein C, partial [Hyphomonadaceae bacterium]|nr:osmotically inducible protein C [Hyphomonadaceae bacterium]
NVKAIATIGAPADAGHVLQHMAHHLEDIETKGQAEVQIAGRAFTIKDQFVSDVREAKVLHAAEKLKRPLLILHAPSDETVGVNNATELFMAARHPKSFVSLDQADHLLTSAEDTEFAADVIAAWAERYVATRAPLAPEPTGENHLVNVSETGEGAYANFVATEYHVLRADEPDRLGGINTGPAPYEYLSAALGACTSITLRMYLERKGWPVEHISVNVKHRKSDEPDANGWKPDIFTRELNVRGNLTEDQRGRLVEIANKCPVHKTLHRSAVIETELGSGT